MKRNTNPEDVLRNLRNMIEEAEEILSRRGGELDERQISELKERVQAGFHRLREYYGGVGSRVKDYYSEAEDRLRDYYEEVEEQLRNRVETTDRTLRTHPYQMATVTFGLGIIVGAIMRAGRSR